MTRSRPAMPTPIRLTAWLASLVIVAALVGMLAAPARAATGEVLYGADGADCNIANLWILDPATGATIRSVGPIGFSVTGLAVHPVTGILYGTTGGCGTTEGHLITINKVTGAGSVVGDLRPPDADPNTQDGATAPDITFGADGTLYGWMNRWYDDGEIERDDLATINLTTGLATIVGDSDLFDTRGGALAGSGSSLTLAANRDNGCLHQISTVTGAATCPATLNGTTLLSLNSADFNAAGTLFAVRGGGGNGVFQLITISTSGATATITVVGPTISNLDAIAFNPAQPLVATKTADAPTSPPAGGNGYTITISNPNAGVATITSITDTLPAGFTYVAGSTTGATTANPSIAGSLLTWTGTFNAPAGGTVVLSFDVIVSALPGAYLNAAGGTAEGNSVTGTGPTAPIQVIAPPAASINDVSVTEGNPGSAVDATFTVTLSSASATAVTMSYATANGTATAADYLSRAGTVTFVPGDTSETITVPVIGDAIDEPNETFVVNLSAPVGATLADAQGTGTIVDDDAPAAATLPDAATGEADGNAGSSGWLLALSLLMGIAAVSLRRSRSRAAIRGR